MRILIATSHRGLWGGVEKYLELLIPGLIQRGHSVGLLYEYRLDSSGRRIDSQGCDVSSWCLKDLGRDAALRSIQSWVPDVVFSQGLDDDTLESSLLEVYPVTFYAHTYYGTCVSGRKCYSWPRIEPCTRQLGVACLLHYYPRRCGGWNPRTMVQLFQLQSKRKSSLRNYRNVLVASQHMQREYQQHGVSPDRLHLVPLPIEGALAGASAPGPHVLGHGILYLGRLSDVKGVKHLLQSLPLAQAGLGYSLRLTIAGDGPERPMLQELAARLGLSVEFTGWIGSPERTHLLQQADLLAVPSLWPEPFGMTGREAGLCGVPAVGFAVGGIPDWLIPGETGELAPANPATPEGLAEAIVRALVDPDHYQKLRVGAWEVARRFSLESHVAQIEQILRPTAMPLLVENSAVSGPLVGKL